MWGNWDTHGTLYTGGGVTEDNGLISERIQGNRLRNINVRYISKITVLKAEELALEDYIV